jgi:pimeloyl-ACP methyl ester carboxylesterase
MDAQLVEDRSRPLLRQLHCPVLAMVGDKDEVVTADENIPALERALADNPRAQVRRLPGLNHFFQRAQTGELSEVADIEETISPRALALIGSWAARQSARQAGQVLSGLPRTPGSSRRSPAASRG